MKGLLRYGIFICSLSTISSAQAIIEIPFTLDESAVPIATLNINGQDGEFMLDTGSQYAFHFTQQFMRQVPWLKRQKEKSRSTDLTGEVYINDRFMFHHVSVNGMSFENAEGVSLAPWGLTLMPDGKRPEHMVIGLGLFQQKALMIDYPRSLFSVAHQLSEFNIDANQWLSLPLTVGHEGIVIEVMNNDNTYKMVLDTGATISMMWKKRVNGLTNNIACVSVMDELDNDRCEAIRLHIKNTTPGDFNVDAILLEGGYTHMETDGLVGQNFLQQHIVIIDFPNNQMLLRPIEES